MSIFSKDKPTGDPMEPKKVAKKEEPRIVEPYRSKRPYVEALETYIERWGGRRGAAAKSWESFDKRLLTLDYKYKVILPGHFYTFEYLDYDLSKDVRNKKVSDAFYDFTPIVWSFKSKNADVFGMNINTLHPLLRRQLFISITKYFTRELEYNTKDKPIPSWKPIPIDGKNYFRLVKLKNKSIINNYDRKHIRNLRIIKWEEIVPASLLYLDKNLIFNSKKETNLKTLFNSQL